jgi:uncharacterized GH25 family protein
VICSGILLANCLLAASPGGGSLTGSVVDESGRPVAGARVQISYTPSIKTTFTAPTVITGPLAATVTTDATGAFRADGLAAGQYIACAEAPASGFLDPCHWSTSAPNFI